MGTWNYLWHFIFSFFLCTETTMVLTEGTSKSSIALHNHTEGFVREQDSRSNNSSNTTMIELNIHTSPSLSDTSLLTHSMTSKSGGEKRTENMPKAPAGEGSSLGVSAGSETTSPISPTMSPDGTATSMGTTSVSAASVSLTSSSPAMSHSFSTLLGSSTTTPSPHQSSTSGTTEAGLTNASHSFMELTSSAPFFTPGSTSIGSGTVMAETTMHSTDASTPSPKISSSTAGTSPTSDTIETSPLSTLPSSVETQAAMVTSAPTMQGQAMAEESATSMVTPSPDVSTASIASRATSPPSKGESPITNQGSSTTDEPNARTSLSVHDTSLVTHSTTRMVGGGQTTENVPTISTGKGSSLGVSAGSETTSPISPTTRPDDTATSMGTASVSAASVSLTPNSPAMSHSFSTLLGSSTTTPSPHQSSTSSTTEAGLTNASHPSMELTSSAPFFTPGSTSIGSGTVMAETTMHSPDVSTPSPKISSSTAGTSPTSDTIETSPLSTLPGSVETQAAMVTSAPTMQGQTTVDVVPNPTSTGRPSPDVSTASIASRATSPPSKGESPITNQGSSTTDEPNARTSLSVHDTSLVTHSTTRMVGGGQTTENVPTISTGKGSSLGVSAGSETTSPISPTTRPDDTATSMGTTSVSAASVSLTSSSPATSHSFSTLLGSSTTTPSPHQSSTSGTTEAGLTNASHPSMELTSSAPFFTPGSTSIGSGTVMAETTMHSTDVSTPSPKTSSSTAGTSPTSDTIETSPLSTLPGSVETQAAMVTSAPTMQGQTTVDVVPSPISTGRPSPNVSTASATSRATSPGGEGGSPIINQGSSTTSEPNAKTSPFLPTTSLVTDFMTNFWKSTSVNPSFTVNCLPVSIKVQNVTKEAIRFSWSGGGTDSLYIISLIDGNQEINKTTTKETKTVFEHLLPGHVYRISVAVLPCAENRWTSVSVRTDPVSCFNKTMVCLPQNAVCPDLQYIACSQYQAFGCSVLLKSQIFNHTLYNSESEGYRTMSESIKTEVVREMRIRLKDDHFDIIMLGFRPGSVIAYFMSLLQNQEPIDVNVMQAQLSEVLKSKFGDQTEITVQSLSTQSSTERSSSWKVAVIVLGVLLGVALVLLLLVTLVYIYMKKRSAKYVVEPRGLLGKFACKHL